MLYDRLSLDSRPRRRRRRDRRPSTSGHATQVVAELYGSLDVSAGGAGGEPRGIYAFLLRELMGARTSRTTERLDAVAKIVSMLREPWVTVAEQLAQSTVATGSSSPPEAWVG